MENLLLAIVIVLAVLVLGLFAMVGFLIYKMFQLKNNPVESSATTYAPEVADAIAQAQQYKDILVSQFCVDHPELFAKGVCALSNKSYCELCLTKENDVKVARKYLDMLLDSKWENLHMLNSAKVSADNLNQLFKTKKELWDLEELPIIVHREFKINIENDQVETYVFVKVREQDIETVTPKLSFLNTEG